MSHLPQQLPNTYYLSLVSVDPASAVPLYRQIYRGIRDAILAQRLTAGTKLPSTRDLAAIWGVSRNTLRNAFDQLIAEGYLEAIVGRGTFIAAQIEIKSPARASGEAERIRPISRLGKLLEPIGHTVRRGRSANQAFAVGVPDKTIFPHAIWQRTVARCARRGDYAQDRYINGVPALREAIASYLVSARNQHAWIFEDDYDSEFRYDGPPITALQGLDNDQRVIYCGAFSKVLLPELRLGYIVLPPDLKVCARSGRLGCTWLY